MLDGLVNDPVYFSIALAVAGLVGGGLLSWLITFAYFKKAQARKLLCYASVTTSYLGHNQGDFHDLTVRYGDKQLRDPLRYTLYVWNCGNVTINRADISNLDPLAFGRSDIEVLEINPIWTTRESTNPTALIDATKKRVSFEFDFLDPNDGFGIQFLADKTEHEKSWPTNLQCYGTIKGLMRSPYQVSANFEKAHWWSFLVGLAIFSFFAFSAVAIGYDAWLSGASVAGLVRLLAAVLFSVVALVAAGITLSDRTPSEEIIPGLLRRPNDHFPDELILTEELRRIRR